MLFLSIEQYSESKTMQLYILLQQLIIYSIIIHGEKQEIFENDWKKLGKFSFKCLTRCNAFFLFSSHKSDESTLCPANLFRCDKIRCLPYAFVCNGEYNCHDKTDEINCSTALINNDLCNQNYSINCEQDILHSIRLVEHGIHYEYTRPIQICIKR